MAKKNIVGRLNDGLVSLMTSLGEKIGAVRYSSTRPDVPDKELLAMYKKSWVVKKYIDKTAADMLKLPREFSGDFDSTIEQRIRDTETELGLSQVFNNALSWASLMGDSLIVAVTDCADEQIASEVDLQGEGIIKFLVFRKGEYTPDSNIITDVKSDHFGEPLTYQIDVGSKQLKFHHSRCLRTKLGRHSIKDRAKFGTSDLQAPYEHIKTFDTAILSTGDTIQEANVDVLFVPGMNNQIAAGQESQVREYARVMKETKSSTGLLLIDAGTSESQGRYEQKNAQFTGLSDVITKMATVLAGALDRPITVLFGQSASGFSSGEEDNKAYYETINGMQESRLRPMQDFADKFILDRLSVADSLSYEYPSIDSINETEEATRFGQYATGFNTLVTSSILTEEVAIREMIARGVLKTVTEEEIKGIVSTGGNSGSWGGYGTKTAAGAPAGAA
ncbi:DUF1073 domain-containing protein [Citrobacter sp. HN-141]|uniref:phage portal protein n=1 Tax=unclassified Citrobacter TaxID=2644389 RepID=UPI0029654218|nr:MULTISPECIES: DUF1073 domain-containing protein [unclassified Citrobacter]MDW2644573.1 DUF1073 domain-containing protein [Citrobacter sp. HN-141]MDW2653920.1 DUF1073 domain-containing protein [Citrobacter sp. HN-120]MDW2696945.1 DUF1073 domain-containing protein [Citrobacter sp. HN-144]